MGNGLAYSVKEKSSTISLVQQNKVAENWCNHIEHPYEKNKAWGNYYSSVQCDWRHWSDSKLNYKYFIVCEIVVYLSFLNSSVLYSIVFFYLDMYGT